MRTLIACSEGLLIFNGLQILIIIMSFLVFFTLSLVSVAALYYFFFIRDKPQLQEEHRDEDLQEEEEKEVPQERARGGMAQRVRNRRRNNEDEDEEVLNDPDVKLSKREILKLQKKQEKERIRDAQRQQREEQDQRRQEQEAKIDEEEQKRKDEEAKQAEEERKRKEDEEKKEREEYNKWKDMFTVEDQGDKHQEDAQFENKLQLFIDFIQVRKVVLFEDLAAEFSLSTKDVIDRIQRLQEQGRLLGITDDRGKFIHITEQEYESVARYIKSRGRVNRGDLLMECNKIVRMQPKAEDTAKIKQEQKKLLAAVEQEFEEEPKV